MTQKEIKDFSIRIRCLTSEMFIKRKDGHIGGAFSIVEALSVLFGKYINQLPEVRDWFVLSKGHAGPSYYATLCLKGFISREDILTLNENGTIIPSHPDRNKTPGVDCTTGSLGQGISEAVGIAYGLQIQKKLGKVYCIVGDGEFNEGQVWEALQFASNKNLKNLVVLIDDNKKQVDGLTSEISCSYNFSKLMNAFNLFTQEVNGNNIKELDEAIEKTNDSNCCSVIVMNTVKGYGIPYFEKLKACHHMNFSDVCIEELKKGIKEMGKEL